MNIITWARLARDWICSAHMRACAPGRTCANDNNNNSNNTNNTKSYIIIVTAIEVIVTIVR